MNRVLPFRGVFYDTVRAGEIARLVAPPYDMISPELQRELHRRDPHNVVRLILGEELPGDDETRNRYSRAAGYLRAWREQGILARDAEAAAYLYEQQYSLAQGPRLIRRGFIARYRLEDLGSGRIFPHERTLSGPKADRMKLMLACQANFSQIFSFYDDPAGEAEAVLDSALPPRPRFDFTDEAGVRHVLHAVTDPGALGRLGEVMDEKILVIADGHHRYETALAYRDRLRGELGDAAPPGIDFVMMYFTNMASEGLTVLPFHRLVSLPEGLGPEAVVEKLGELGNLEEIAPGSDDLETAAILRGEIGRVRAGEYRFGIWSPPRARVLTLTRQAGSGGEESPVAKLDVSVLHREVLDPALGGAADETRIEYLTGEAEIMKRIKGRKDAMAFLLNPTGVGQVRDIAARGLRMPPKSTNFHPKLISGLLLNLLDR